MTDFSLSVISQTNSFPKSTKIHQLAKKKIKKFFRLIPRIHQSGGNMWENRGEVDWNDLCAIHC